MTSRRLSFGPQNAACDPRHALAGEFAALVTAAAAGADVDPVRVAFVLGQTGMTPFDFETAAGRQIVRAALGGMIGRDAAVATRARLDVLAAEVDAAARLTLDA